MGGEAVAPSSHLFMTIQKKHVHKILFIIIKISHVSQHDSQWLLILPLSPSELFFPFRKKKTSYTDIFVNLFPNQRKLKTKGLSAIGKIFIF